MDLDGRQKCSFVNVKLNLKFINIIIIIIISLLCSIFFDVYVYYMHLLCISDELK